MSATAKRQLLTGEQMAEATGYRPNTIYVMAKRGEIAVIKTKVGKPCFYDAADIPRLKYLYEQTAHIHQGREDLTGAIACLDDIVAACDGCIHIRYECHCKRHKEPILMWDEKTCRDFRRDK